MVRFLCGRRALAVASVCALVLTVAAEASLKDGARIRLSNEELEEKLQVGVKFKRPSFFLENVFFAIRY